MGTEDQWTALDKVLALRVKQVDEYSSRFARVRLHSKSILIVLSAVVAADESFDFCGWKTTVPVLCNEVLRSLSFPA